MKIEFKKLTRPIYHIIFPFFCIHLIQLQTIAKDLASNNADFSNAAANLPKTTEELIEKLKINRGPWACEWIPIERGRVIVPFSVEFQGKLEKLAITDESSAVRNVLLAPIYKVNSLEAQFTMVEYVNWIVEKETGGGLDILIGGTKIWRKKPYPESPMSGSTVVGIWFRISAQGELLIEHTIGRSSETNLSLPILGAISKRSHLVVAYSRCNPIQKLD